MKSKNQKYSQLGSWARLWDYRLNAGLHVKDFRRLRLAGFEVDSVSFQLVRIRRKEQSERLWTANNGRLRALLLRSFPKAQTDPKQRQQAGRWARVIQLYFRAHKSQREVAEEMHESLVTIHNIIGRINRVICGKRASCSQARARGATQDDLTC